MKKFVILEFVRLLSGSIPLFVTAVRGARLRLHDCRQTGACEMSSDELQPKSLVRIYLEAKYDPTCEDNQDLDILDKTFLNSGLSKGSFSLIERIITP